MIKVVYNLNKQTESIFLDWFSLRPSNTGSQPAAIVWMFMFPQIHVLNPNA